LFSTEVLIKEHEMIREVLVLLNDVIQRLDSGSQIPISDIRDIVVFIQVFADRYHHGKEEDLLFPALEAAGMARDGSPIGIMLMEHGEGRQLVQKMREALKTEDMFQFSENARNFVTLLDQHIFKENNILYPMADRSLSPNQQEELKNAYEKVEMDQDGPARWTEAQNLVKTLTEKYG